MMNEKRRILNTKLDTNPTRKTHTKRILLNAMGTKFEIRKDTFKKFPVDSRLGKLSHFENSTHSEILELCDEYDLENSEFYFEKDPDILKSIINYYINDELHLYSNICEVYLEKGFLYWGVSSDLVKRCCKTYYEEKLILKINDIKSEKRIINELEICDQKIKKTMKERLWKVTQSPSSSKTALAYFILTNSILLFWLLYFIYLSSAHIRTTIDKAFQSNATQEESEIGQFYEKTFLLIDMIVFIYFFLDLLFRFSLSPEKTQFIQNWLHIIDFLSILFFFLIFFVIIFSKDTQGLYFFRRIVESTRIILLLNLTKFSWRFQTISKALQKSAVELSLGLFYIILSVFFVSTVAFYSEVNQNSQFTSIAATFWWALMTITTVGYGDLCPITAVGRLVGVFTAIWGILLIALPVAVIGSAFTKIYRIEENNFKLKLKLKKRMLIPEIKDKETNTHSQTPDKVEYKKEKITYGLDSMAQSSKFARGQVYRGLLSFTKK